MIFDLFIERRYEFRQSGTRSDHCTYCPLLPGADCGLTCSVEYEKVKAERAADGVIVNDQP